MAMVSTNPESGVLQSDVRAELLFAVAFSKK
jgi:hypothetical protein